MIESLFGAKDDEWVVMVGRYMLNMGAAEMTSRLLLAEITGDLTNPIHRSDFGVRLGYLRKRFPRKDKGLHSWAMDIFAIAQKHVEFRNIIAHNPIVITGEVDGEKTIHGILHVTQKGAPNIGHLVALDELKERVAGSAAMTAALLKMQGMYVSVQNAG